MTGGRGGRPTRLGVNLLWLVPGVVGGSEEYATRLLRGLLDLDRPDLEVRLYGLDALRAAHPDLVSAAPTSTLRLEGRLKALRVVAETTWLTRRLRADASDVVWHPGGVVPLLTGGAATVVTVHDLQPLDIPQNFSAAKVAYLRAVLPRSVRRATVATSPSETVASQLVERYGRDPATTFAVPHGLGDEQTADIAAADVARVARRVGLAGRRWLLYPVITYAHKNHRTLLAAFERVAASHPDLDLVLTGGEGPAEAEVIAEIAARGLDERVHRLGRVPRAELDALLAGATAVPFPSRYEGFGNGVLEAMARGVPVVAAAALALPEVVGDAGLLVAPDDIDGWVVALTRVVDDEDLRRTLAREGRRRAAEFTDEAGAKALLRAVDLARDSGSGDPAR